MSKRVLLLAVPIGAGHIAAARAVESALNNLDANIQTRFVNAFDWTLPEYGKVYRLFYEYSVRHNQDVLESLYDSNVLKRINVDFLPFAHRVLIYHFPRLIKEYQPQIIISTHFSPTYCAILLKRMFRFTLLVTVTDYHIHPFWFNPDIDFYIVAHDDLIPQLEKFGVDRSKILPYGIPINPRFEKAVAKKNLREKLNLSPDRVTVLVIGGKICGGKWVEIVRELMDFDIELIAVCGANKYLRRKIERLKGKASLSTLGLVDNLHEYIQSSDFLITKAGGISTTEAMVSGATMILANSLPLSLIHISEPTRPY